MGWLKNQIIVLVSVQRLQAFLLKSASAMPGLSSTLFATWLFMSASTSAMPYCNYNTSACCEEGSFQRIPDGIFYPNPGQERSWSLNSFTSRASFPTCSLLNLVPNASDSVCNASHRGGVCNAIQASSQAQGRLE